jgi:DNA-directed RNA polymerase subunit N (RpoN/RPB10)
MGNIITVQCPTCGKDFQQDQWWYNYKLKRNNGRGVFCSYSCGQKNKIQTESHRQKISLGVNRAIIEGRSHHLSPIITINCAKCGKEIQMKRWQYNQKINRSQRDQLFCSQSCAMSGRVPTEEHRRKISDRQAGISVPSRGRSRPQSEEVRLKISLAKKGKTGIVADWEIVTTEMLRRGISKYVMTRRPVPDAIWIEDGKLVALELEKKSDLHPIKEKMDIYRRGTNYDKVYLVWYSLKGEFRKEWIFENGAWTI